MEFWDGSGFSWTTCKQSAPRSTPTPHHSIFTDWMLFLTPDQQRQSTEGKKALAWHWHLPTSLWNFAPNSALFATASRRCGQQNSLSLWITLTMVRRVTAGCTKFITGWSTVTYCITSVCCITCSYTVVHCAAVGKLWLTHHIAWSICGSRACFTTRQVLNSTACYE